MRAGVIKIWRLVWWIQWSACWSLRGSGRGKGDRERGWRGGRSDCQLAGGMRVRLLNHGLKRQYEGVKRGRDY